MDKIKGYFNKCVSKFKKTRSCKVEAEEVETKTASASPNAGATESAPPNVSKRSVLFKG